MITVVAARLLDPVSFGIFGIVFVVYQLAASGIRAVVSEPALVDPVEAVSSPGALLGAGLVVGGAVGVLTATVGLALGGVLGPALLVLAGALPGMVLQDVARYLAFADRRPHVALRVDVIWLAVQACGLLLFSVMGGLTLLRVIVAWAGAGSLAGICALLPHRRVMAWSVGWIRQHWSFSWRYLVSFGTTFGAAYAATLGLGAIAGVAAVGSVRGAQLVLSPLTMVFAATTNMLVVEVTHCAPDARQLRRRTVLAASSMAGVAAVVTAASLVVPDGVGRVILGESWESSQRLLLAAGVQAVMIGALAGARIGLIGSRAIRINLALDLQLAPVVIVLPTVGAVVAEAPGFLWALVATQALIALFWWYRFLHHLAGHDPGASAASPVGAGHRRDAASPPEKRISR